MLNAVYRLTAPRRFEVSFEDIDITDDIVIVRPTHLAICNADQRYYQGSRPAEVMAEKLPMALIHEGIGRVVMDKSGEFAPGQMVVMVPNTPSEEDEIIAENYLRSSSFRSSGYDGFMQDSVAMQRDRLVALPDHIDPDMAAFTELISVCLHTVKRFDRIAHDRRRSIGIWGDGNLAYIVAVILRYMLPGSLIYVFGKHEDKLENFSFADRTFHIDDIPPDIHTDHAFECVGGIGTSRAINQIIDLIEPEGTIAIMGVAEELVPLNTRMILEKGLRIFGSSRSGREDFAETVKMYTENPEITDYLAYLVGNIIEAYDIEDFTKAFETDLHKAWGKTIIHWNK